MLGDHIRCEFDTNDRSVAFLSTSELVDTAVVFVHGFRGHRERTWRWFHPLIDQNSSVSHQWRTSDLFFYGYSSVTAPIRVNVNRFGSFLDRVLAGNTTELLQRNDSLTVQTLGLGSRAFPRHDITSYSKLIVAAHSEGAVIVRTLVRDLALRAREEALDAARSSAKSAGIQLPTNFNDLVEYQSWSNDSYGRILSQPQFRLLTADVCLFAPAHAGYSITGPLASILELPGFSQLLRPALSFSTAKADLEPSSPLITVLRRDTDALSRDSAISALRARILWGENEKVVYVDKFSWDTEEFVSNKDHINICKPSHLYLRPITFARNEHDSKYSAV
jgi:hypothetical protein